MRDINVIIFFDQFIYIYLIFILVPLINLKDFAELLNSIGLKDQTINMIYAFKEVDKDKDDMINFEEFSMLIMKHLRRTVEENLEIAFDTLDCNGDSVITLDDLRSYIEEIGENIDDEELQDMLSEADIMGKIFNFFKSNINH